MLLRSADEDSEVLAEVQVPDDAPPQQASNYPQNNVASCWTAWDLQPAFGSTHTLRPDIANMAEAPIGMILAIRLLDVANVVAST